jgi:hypothetical protein
MRRTTCRWVGRSNVGVLAGLSVLAMSSALGCARERETWSAAAGIADSGTEVAPSEASSGAEGASILRARKHLNRDGLFDNSGITVASLPTLRPQTTFAGTVIGNVYGSPLYVEVGPGGHGAFFVATSSNYVYALDEVTGTPLPGWPIQAGSPAIQTGTPPGCQAMSPMGITGTPAIDLATRLIVFDAVTADANGNIAAHTIQAWSIDDPSKGPVWSVDVGAKWPTFEAIYQQQRSAVLIVNGVAYVSYGSFNDCAPYHGWLIGVPLVDPSAAQAYSTPVIGAGIWGPGGPASDGTSIFAVTGNRAQDLDPDASPSWAGSNAIFRFGGLSSLAGHPDDFFAPPDWDALDRFDEDLGGSGPLLVDAPNMTPSALAVTLGKNGVAYLLDRSDLGGLDAGPVSSATIFRGTAGVPVGVIINAAAWATVASGTYIVAKGYRDATASDCPLPPDGGSDYDLVTLRLDPTAPNYMRTVWCASTGGMGSPSITLSDSANDAIVWTEGAEGDNALHAWDLATGASLFSGETLGGANRFSSPIAVHGRLLVGANAQLYSFAVSAPSSP